LTFREGSSDKVYELHRDGSTLTVKWGRRGSKLQSKVSEHGTPAAARAALEEALAGKVSKGYRPEGDDFEDPDGEELDLAEYEAQVEEAEAEARRGARTRAPASSAPRGVMLAKAWEGADPTGWWMSEKLDGMRAYWTGSSLYTRNGNEVAIPESFRRILPAGTALDGELFLGRGKFQEAISTVRKMAPTDARWAQIRFMVFDAPEVSGGFEVRMVRLKAIVDAACEKAGRNCPLVFVEQEKCTGADHLRRHHARIASQGGEGVMLRRPKSAYARVRSPDLLKVKNFLDAEAQITGYTKGTGKHAGRLGAYTARLIDSGVEFKIGTGISDSERDRPKKVGTVVTVRFQELTRDGVPRFPSLVGARDYE
jgi:DNA ligase-1